MLPATFDTPPILDHTQDESSSRLLHHSCAFLRRDVAGGHSNHSLELRQSRWVVSADHLFDVTPQKEIWGVMSGDYGGQLMVAPSEITRPPIRSVSHSKAFLVVCAGAPSCWNHWRLNVSAQRCCRELMICLRTSWYLCWFTVTVLPSASPKEKGADDALCAHLLPLLDCSKAGPMDVKC